MAITPLYARPTTYFSWKFDGTSGSIDEFNEALTSNGTDSQERGLAVYVDPETYTWFFGSREFNPTQTQCIKLDWAGAHLIDTYEAGHAEQMHARLSEEDLGVREVA